MYKILTTKTFISNLFKNFDKLELIKFNKFKEKLKLNQNLGDILRVPFVREFRLKSGKRIYFIIYEDLKIILFVRVSNKKTQKFVIGDIFNNLHNFKDFVESI